MQETLNKPALEIRKTMKRGAATKRVAALRSDHCAPISPSWVKRTRPAVSGRAASLLVTIKGQWNTFQCQATDDRPI